VNGHGKMDCIISVAGLYLTLFSDEVAWWAFPYRNGISSLLEEWKEFGAVLYHVVRWI